MTPSLLGNRYRLGERIAAGGMGSVYRGVDETLGRQVAVKVLRRELADDPTFLERFRREARAVAVVSHPGVAGVYDYGELGGQPFIVMELVEGETLAALIAARGRLPWPEAFAIGEQVARGLAAAGAHGLVHRDVKPANILLGADGRAKLTDFGIAKAATSATLTGTGMVLGSANYVAPEQAQGGDVGPAADQYSLGCVLFEAVTGETPYRGSNPVAIATQHVSAPVPDPREHRPDLPAAAAELIRKAMAKEPERRFASAAAMADGLAAAAATPVRQAPVSPTPPAPWTAVGTVGGSGRRPSGRALAVGILVVIALLLLAWLPRSGLLDPPAGQPERSRPASSTIAPAVGGPSPPAPATSDEHDKRKAKDRDKGDKGD
ncbi:MAG TPA: serine/threonine-protein kinase [Actinomycetes bacterium]|jgi:serine/threonine-protein kinase|nr:serine/threonine-protein kinase [Actinomycetes bacterium]